MSHSKILTTTPLFVVADMPRFAGFLFQERIHRAFAVGRAHLFRHGSPRRLRDHALVGRIRDRNRPNGPANIWDLYIRLEDVAA